MTTEQGMAFIDSLAECAKPILVFSGGEPLYRKDIFTLAKHAQRRGITTALATNGTLIDEEMANKIVAAGFQRVAISIDGADAETHDRFRGIPGSFARALSGFLRLRRRGMSMQINSTLARHNAAQREKLYELALAVGADALHIFMLVPVGCGVQISADNQLPADEYESILNWFYDKSKEGRLQTKATCAPHYYRIMRQRAKAEGVKLSFATHGMDAVTRGCLAGSAVCFVSHKGEVYPLRLFAGSRRKRNTAILFGYLGEIICIRRTSRYRQPHRQVWLLVSTRTSARLPGACVWRNGQLPR